MTWKKKPIKDISNLSYSFTLSLANAEFLFMKIKVNKSEGSGNKLTLGLGRDFSHTTILGSGEKYCKYFLAVLDAPGTERCCRVEASPEKPTV